MKDIVLIGGRACANLSSVCELLQPASSRKAMKYGLMAISCFRKIGDTQREWHALKSTLLSCIDSGDLFSALRLARRRCELAKGNSEETTKAEEYLREIKLGLKGAVVIRVERKGTSRCMVAVPVKFKKTIHGMATKRSK